MSVGASVMQRANTGRRTQFSSCDECRRSRVGCDAASQRLDLTEQSVVTCTRCRKRDRQCTFKWIKNAKSGASKASTPSRRSTRTTAALPPAPATREGTQEPVRQADPSENLEWITQDRGGESWIEGCETADFAQVDRRDSALPLSPNATSSTRSYSDYLDPVDSQWLECIYQQGFDDVFGSWMGRCGCPFLLSENSPAGLHVSMVETCTKLDKWMREASTADGATPSRARNGQQDIRDLLIEQSLKSTIAAFSARWLPITCTDKRLTKQHRTVAQSLWRHARRDMLRVINRPSYRSMLSLFLFALTPIPYGVSEDEETDGISGQACVHAALQQIQALRARHRNLQFSGSKVSPSVKRSTVPGSAESMDTSEFITAESMAYWAALTFDTSASLTLNCRPFLSSGLFGFESELPWRLVKSASKIFHEKVQSWPGNGTLDMTDKRANEVISSGTGWKLLMWKLIAIFKEALRDGHDETEVAKCYTAVMAAMQEFNDIFKRPLYVCASRMPFLGQQAKLRWYSLMLHYNLSILMLADVLEVLDRSDLLLKFAESISEAENTVMSTLIFGLQNSFTLHMTDSQEDGSLYAAGATSSCTILSIDPYPHHVVASVQLMHKAIERDAAIGKISDIAYANLISTLEQVLRNLPANSKSVQAAQERFSLNWVSEEITTPHQDLTQYC